MKKLLILFFILFVSYSFAQPYFYRYDSYPVKINNNTIKHPWAGGLNFIQSSNIDLNLDGTLDLFLFDRAGNKIRTFINNGTPNTINYTYAPQYQSKFPIIENWVLLADYDCDGKKDIFCNVINILGSGIQVYKNTSSIATGLQFTLIKTIAYSTYIPPNTNHIPLYVSSGDIPAISDIDNDGDLDVVTFANGGVYLEYHKNKSKELGYNCDSLIFEVKNNCFGYASENFMTNFFTLNDTCPINVSNPEMHQQQSENRQRHSGSCELCIDLNGDGDKDFIAGDVSYKNLTMLTNGGTPTANHFTAIDAAFPLNNGGGPAVSLTVFPCAFYADINNDNKNDLVVSPNVVRDAENFASMIYYENIGTANFPVFQYKQNDLLQNEMIDVGEGAYPVLFDYDKDGLKDLFIGNHHYHSSTSFVSKIAYFKNTGTATSPAFDLITRDFNNYSSFGIVNMVPAFGDLDSDGDSDMIIGSEDGRLHYFENTASAATQASFVLTQSNFKNLNGRIIDVGFAATPVITDVDGDGKNDLIIGSRNGKLACYRRISTTGFPQMDSITHYFGNINVTSALAIDGNSFPFLYKNAGKSELLVGSESGYLFRYDNIDGNLTGAFNLLDSKFLNVREGGNSSPSGSDVNNDGLWDLFIGNYSGGVGFYKATATAIDETKNDINWNFELFPNPAANQLTIQIVNNKNDLFKVEIINMFGQLILSEQINNHFIQLTTENINQGIYICKITQINSQGEISSGMLTKRLIIKH